MWCGCTQVDNALHEMTGKVFTKNAIKCVGTHTPWPESQIATPCLGSGLDVASEFGRYARGLNVGQQRLIFSIAVIAHDAVCITHLGLQTGGVHQLEFVAGQILRQKQSVRDLQH